MEESQERLKSNLSQPQSGVEGEAPAALPMEGATRAPRMIGSVEKKTIGVLFLLLLGSLYFRSLQVSVSLLIGGVIALGSFILLRRGIESLVQRQQESPSALKTSFLVLKYPLLLALIAFLILKTPLHIVAWVVGFLSLVLAIVLEGLIPSRN